MTKKLKLQNGNGKRVVPRVCALLFFFLALLLAGSGSRSRPCYLPLLKIMFFVISKYVWK